MPPKTLSLKCTDNKKVEFDTLMLAKYSILIGDMLDTTQTDEREVLNLPFYNITEPIMQKVKFYLLNFNDNAEYQVPITAQNNTFESVFKSDQKIKEFFKSLSHEELHLLTDASNFMNIPKLLEGCKCAIAIYIKQAAIAYSKEALK